MLFITPKFHHPILIKDSGETVASFMLTGLSNNGIDVTIDTKLSVRENNRLIQTKKRRSRQQMIPSNIGRYFLVGDDIKFLLNDVTKYGIQVGIEAPELLKICRESFKVIKD